MAFEEVVIDLGYARLVPIPGATRNLLYAGGSSVETANISVVTGWENTKTVEASVEVTAEVSSSYGAAEFSLSATVGFGYSDSTTLSKETTVSQDYNFRPGYITAYYQWAASVKDKQILNGQVKLEAKSTAELQKLKKKVESEASVVKLTLKKIAPPKTFTIRSVASGYFLNCHSYGKGNCKMEAHFDIADGTLVAEKRGENLYRFKNKSSRWYLHMADGGTGNLEMFPGNYYSCQTFQLIPTGVRDYFQLGSYYDQNFKLHSDNSGKGNLWMNTFNDKQDPEGRIFKFDIPRNSHM